MIDPRRVDWDSVPRERLVECIFEIHREFVRESRARRALVRVAAAALRVMGGEVIMPKAAFVETSDPGVGIVWGFRRDVVGRTSFVLRLMSPEEATQIEADQALEALARSKPQGSA